LQGQGGRAAIAVAVSSIVLACLHHYIIHCSISSIASPSSPLPTHPNSKSVCAKVIAHFANFDLAGIQSP
jgi:hypothetical protein